MTNNVDIINAAVALIVKAAILASRLLPDSLEGLAKEA